MIDSLPSVFGLRYELYAPTAEVSRRIELASIFHFCNSIENLNSRSTVEMEFVSGPKPLPLFHPVVLVNRVASSKPTHLTNPARSLTASQRGETVNKCIESIPLGSILSLAPEVSFQRNNWLVVSDDTEELS